ncbi:MAG: hypothetical protein EON87_15275 [Brevundimonas sp.]|nr:MAG: hypothetical protein EON87_15275 [Brevundimonas sp.]
MISMLTAAPAFSVRTRADEAREAKAAAMPSADDARRSTQDQQKALAARRMQAVLERFKALKLTIKMDPKAALRMATDMAKELKAAVKAYQQAGGRNVSMGEFAMIRRQAADAAKAQETQADAAQADAQAKAAERLAQAETDALGDMGFFDLVKSAIGALRDAHDKIRAQTPQSLSNPDEDDWKAAEKAQSELEKAVAFAAAGVSIRV